MKKIGILTINDDTNFGNRLQNYAVQEVIKKLDFDVETIENKSVKRFYKIKNITGNILKKFSKELKYKRYNKFIDFNKNIKKTSKRIDVNNIPKGLSAEYSYFITGSDQVWNPNFGRLSNIDLLEFANNNQKISFSASFGINELEEQYKQKTKEALSTFKLISVREDAGKKIVEDLTGRTDVEVLVDPTMLLSAEDWDKVSKKPDQLKFDKYILNYFLGELPEEWRNEINRIAKENNCEIINILDKNSPFYQTGPSEFLYLEKNAFMVCTDSFHSSVFSIIYDTPFVVFDRKQNGIVSMNSRIDTLLSKFSLQNRRFNGSITEDLLKCDYSETKKVLEKEKEKAFDFLKRALDID